MNTPPYRRRMTPAELAAAKERANLKRRVRRLWAGDSTLAEICEEVEMTEDELREFATGLGLSERQEPSFFLPTPHEIRLATARIRAGWSQAERESRLEGVRSGRISNATGDDIPCLRRSGSSSRQKRRD